MANPLADAGFNDDWSYSHVAMRLAETGKLHYNGWGSPLILFQVLWAAPWIRLFGFSFDLLRIVTIPFALGFVVITYFLGRRTGLTREFALFGALIVGTSPLFLPFAASFMTEAYSCFFVVLCLYAAVAAAEASETTWAKRWLWVLAISGVVGGSDRQVVWVAPLALIPYLAWVRRRDQSLRRHAAAAYIFCASCIGVLMAEVSQPYAPLALSRQQIVNLLLQRWWITALVLTFLTLTALLLSLPALLCVAALWRRFERRALLVSGLLCALVVACLGALFGSQGLVPFLGNILTPSGILIAGQEALGAKPVVIPIALRIAQTWFLLFTVAAFVHFYRRHRDWMPRVTAMLFLVFLCSYAVLLIPGAFANFIYDRYLLLILPVSVNLILLSFRLQLKRVPAIAWAGLALFASYGVATTHDYYGALRARVFAAENLERRGIPRNHISAGLEYDGWTQLQESGAIQVVLYGDKLDLNKSSKFWLWPKTTAIDPQFVLTYWPNSDLPAKGLLTVHFATWLPPFQRTVIALKRIDLPASPQH